MEKSTLKYFMVFKAPETELKYSESKLVYQLWFSAVFLVGTTVLKFGEFYSFGFESDLKLNIISMCFLFFEIIAWGLLFKSQAKRGLIEVYLMAIMIRYLLTSLQSFHNSSSSAAEIKVKEICLIRTIYFSMPISRIKLSRALLFYLLLANLNVFLIRGAYELNSNEFFNDFTFLFISVAFKILFEYDDRKRFAHMLQSEAATSESKRMLEEVLPISLIKVRRGELVFMNSSASRIFRPDFRKETKNDDAFERLKQITLERVDSRMSSSKEMQKEEVFIDLCNQDEILIKDFEPTRLGDVILKNDEHFEYAGKFQMSAECAQEADRHFDVMVLNISHFEPETKLIVLSENGCHKIIEELNNQVRNKDNILATVSHDLRTPLNGVMGILRLVYEQIDSKCLKKSLKIALNSSEFLLFMINDILDLNLIANGKFGLNPQNFKIVSLVNETSKLIKFQASKKGVQLLIEFNLCTSTTVFNDSNRIKQVLLNLLGNALKFTRKGFIKITVSRGDDQVQSYDVNHTTPGPIIISVEDSGIGMKKEDLSKLFSQFGKLHDEEKLNPTGIGLGLAISQNLVRAINESRGGEVIQVQSEYGKGSKFWFPVYDFCQRRTDNTVKLQSPGTRECGPTNEFVCWHDIPVISPFFLKNKMRQDHRKSVLIVDDDQINILVATRYMESFKLFDISTAFNGDEALAQIQLMASKKKFFDLVLMDCNMPILDGFEATKKIIELIKTEVIPPLYIVGISADSSTTHLKECFSCGMIDFLLKPYKKEDLKEKIANLMQVSLD